MDARKQHPPWAIELSLAADHVPLLLRHPALREAGSQRPSRASKLSLTWFDTADGALTADGVCLSRQEDSQGIVWLRERMVPDGSGVSPPGTPPALIARMSEKPAAPSLLLPVAAFEGTIRDLTAPDAELRVSVLQGELRAVAATRQVCRVVITDTHAGDHDVARALALDWADTNAMSVADQTLAADALTLAGRVPPLRPLGAPSLRPAMRVGDSFAHVVGHLAGVIGHHASRVQNDTGPEPVHQMRVALRRLRSAVLLFRRAVACPALADVSQRLKQLGIVLGPPRDWDVFTLGTGRDIALAFPHDAAVATLLAAAERRRRAGYAALNLYLASPAWRQLGVALVHLATACPWQHVSLEDSDKAVRHAELQQSDITAFATRALGKRLVAVVAPGHDISGLDSHALHEIRLKGKRLRYAAEFFAPLFPGGATRRFLRRMTALQERLGLLNDGAVAARLMHDLPGRSGAHHYAIGVVQGFVAARATGGKRKIVRSWQRFLKQDPFWA